MRRSAFGVGSLLGLLVLGGCEVNPAPATVMAAPSPVVVAPTPLMMQPSTVVVQPRAY